LNQAWIQHLLRHLAPSGTAGFVMANGVAQSIACNQSVEGDSRKSFIECGLVDSIVALPGVVFHQLTYINSTA